MTKLAFDHPEWVFHFGSDLCFDLLKLLLQCINGAKWVQCLSLLALHGDMPLEVLGCIRSFFDPLETCIAIAISFLAVHKTVGFYNVIDVG